MCIRDRVAGAVVASMTTRLDRATSVIPLAIVVGVLMIGLNVISNVWVAAPFLVLLGALCGFLIVPMNALLQHLSLIHICGSAGIGPATWGWCHRIRGRCRSS